MAEKNNQLILPYDDLGRVVHDEEHHDGFIDELEQNRFVAVQGVSNDQIEEMMHAYAKVMDLPKPSADYVWNNYSPGDDEVLIRPGLDSEKYWHVYRSRLDRPGKPAGLTNRSLENEILIERGLENREASDKKEFFHYQPGMLEELKAMHDEYGWGPIPTELVDFMNLAAPIHERGTEIIEQCICAMEENAAFHGVKKALLSNREWMKKSPLRVLAYHASDQPMLGQLHRDKGTATLAITESHKGLRVSKKADAQFNPDKQGYELLDKAEASHDDNMWLIERPQGQAAFFVSDGFVRETGIIHPAAEPTQHDIINFPGKEFIPGKIARYAVILFFSSPSGVFSSKRENHGKHEVAA